MHDTTFHSLSLFRSAHVRAQKPAGGLRKHKRVVLFSPRARESALSFLSLLSEDFFERIASDDSIVVAEDKSEEKISNDDSLHETYLLYLGSSLSRYRWYPKTPLPR